MKTKIYNGPNYHENDPFGKKRGVKTKRDRTRKTGRWIVPASPQRSNLVFDGVTISRSTNNPGYVEG